MIIWQGLGILIPIVMAAFVLAIQYSVGAIMNDPEYYRLHGWPKLLALWLAAAALFAIARILSKVPAKVYIDKETGKEVVFRQRHSLFFVPVAGWSVISFCIGCYLLFAP